MKTTVRLCCLMACMGLSMLNSSCTKSSSEVPEPVQAKPTSADLTGRVQPAAAILGVRAMSAAGVSFPCTYNTTTGVYTFADLPLGLTYTVEYIYQLGYVPLASQQVVLNAATTLPTLTATQSTAAYTINGTVVVPAVNTGGGYGGPNSRLLQLGVAPPAASFPLEITFPNSPAVGTYNLTTSATYVTVRNTSGGPNYTTLASLASSPTSGTLVITAVNPTYPRTFSGTFSFVAATTSASGGTPLTTTVTNGTFTDVAY
ncbi:DUF6252 family protein [Hymenobacter sp. M29]|uniref:DUF6252 family protein n=1 Tax=Hymenobacter mellowenesis TaxID=3063995 RepID=A0ABT9AGW4_9BACT|nr:DUF6252 family protein [Hymenobacter sp. M29]MDO7849084.1 DUF6252 family protein [Hymenobacter sp. M29]